MRVQWAVSTMVRLVCRTGVLAANGLGGCEPAWNNCLLEHLCHMSKTLLRTVARLRTVAWVQLLPKVSARGVMVAGGLHAELGTKYFRMGHMGECGHVGILNGRYDQRWMLRCSVTNQPWHLCESHTVSLQVVWFRVRVTWVQGSYTSAVLTACVTCRCQCDG